MKRSIQPLAILLALFCMAGTPALAQEDNNPPKDFKALFNGKDLDGWTGGGTEDPVKLKEKLSKMNPEQLKAHYDGIMANVNKHWRVEEGELISDGHGLHLVTEAEYADFEMWVDWKLTKAGGDSGIYLRDAPQVQLWDPGHKPAHRHGSDKGSGGLWNNDKHERFPSEVADNPIGQWNRMYIRMVGPYVTVILNDKKVVDNVVMDNYFDRKAPIFQSGRIHLQTHGSETRFRNVFVREYSDEESGEILKEIAGDEDEFSSLFNGEDFTGWTGALDQYKIDGEGAEACIVGGTGSGVLATEQQYSDFIVRMQFKLPPAGNNGLSIRGPSPGKVSLELQVLDNTADQYRDLKPYQYHGSAYGIAPARRGFLRPVGQWNDQEVYVKGDHIRVVLNGYEILNVHLKKAAPQHASANQTKGHFGLFGHNDPVAFRDIRIREITQ